MKNLAKCRTILDLINEVAIYSDAIRSKVVDAYKITPIQVVVLEDIFNHEGTKVTKVCDRLCKSTNTISPLINRLVEYGYLEKEKDKDDNRVVFVYTTEKAKILMEKINRDTLDLTYEYFNKLNDSDMNKIEHALLKLTTSIKEEINK